MTNREKLLSTLRYEPGAELPIAHFGYWKETVRKWTEEGHVRESESWDEISRRLGFDLHYAGVHCYGGPADQLFPPFEEKVLKTLPDGSMHVFSKQGVIELFKPGVVSIPTEIGHTLTDRGSWEREYLPRLQFSQERISKEAVQKAAEIRDRGEVFSYYAGSLYGSIRNWFGIVGLSYATEDDPGLVDEVIRTVGELEVKRAEMVLETAKELGLSFDLMHFWEDICFNKGPLVNPAVFAEKVGPYYKKITDLGKAHGVGIFSVDCDGKIDELVPIWLENGVNTMFPIEVGTWNGSIAPWREKYGKRLLGVGGMDKRAFACDRTAVDSEIERLKPLVALGGYIPCPDHLIPPDGKFELVQYYCEKMRRTFT